MQLMNQATSLSTLMNQEKEKLFSKIFSLGAVHDGSKIGNIDATSCNTSLNNIMAPSTGKSTNANGLYFFSNCSIKAFKMNLFESSNK